MPAVPHPTLQILIPVFNDWQVVSLLLPQIDRVLSEHDLSAEIVLVDDGSTQRPEEAFRCPPLTAARKVSILELRRNLGHQRAIAIGMTWLYENAAGQAVLVMDGDGEDDPADLPRLLEKFEALGHQQVIFAARARRSEGIGFKLGYRSYQAMHYLLTGYRVRVGNFSLVPWRVLGRLAVVSELWNHYSAAIFNARIPYDMVPTARAARLGGQSKMNLTSLVVHGLSALSVYSHIIGVRMLFATSAVIALLVAALLALQAVGLTQNVPAWMSYLAGLLVVILLQALTAGVIFVFIVLGGRQGASFLPLRDYKYFVSAVHPVSTAGE